MTNEQILEKIKQEMEGFSLSIEENTNPPVIDIGPLIDFIVNKTINYEREECASLCEQLGAKGYGTLAIAASIRSRT